MIKHERNRNLIDYIKKNLKKGYTAESLKWALIKQGYIRIDITKAFEEANKELAQEAPVLKEKPEIKYELIDEEEPSVNSSFWGKIKSWFGE